VRRLAAGVGFLGFRMFPRHRLLHRKNLRRFEKRLWTFRERYEQGDLEREKIVESFEGWLSYAANADTYKYRRHATRLFNTSFPARPNVTVSNPRKRENFLKKMAAASMPFSRLKTRQLFLRGMSIEEIARRRGFTEGTIWNHLCLLIEHRQLPLWRVLPKEKIDAILPHVASPDDQLADIRTRLRDDRREHITFDEISRVLAHLRSRPKERRTLQ